MRGESIIRAVERVLGPYEQCHNGEYDYPCPFCPPNNQGHLHINYVKGKAICHRCDFARKSLDGVLTALNINIADVWKEIRNGVPDDQRTLTDLERMMANLGVNRVAAEKRTPLPPEYIELSNSNSRIGSVFRRYAHKRHVTDDQIEECRIGFAISGRYRGRLIFPVTKAWRVSYFTTRLVYGEGKKSLHASSPVGSNMFGFDAALELKRAVIVEAPLDAFMAEGGVATLGGHLSDAQLARFAEYKWDEITVCYDSDAIRHTYKTALRIQMAVKVKRLNVLILKPKKIRDSAGEIQTKTTDPNDFGKRFQGMLEARKPFKLTPQVQRVLSNK